MKNEFENNETVETKKKIIKSKKEKSIYEPTAAFVGVSWIAFLVGVVAYFIGLWNAEMELNEKGYYFTVIMFGLFGVISVQKNVRDRLEGIQVSDLYYGISWFAAILSVILIVVGLYNATLALSEKGFFGISFMMSLYAAIVIQKNVRDSEMKIDK